MFRFLVLVGLCWAFLSHESRAQDRPPIHGTDVGSYDVSTGSTWTSLTTASFTCTTTAAACKSGWVFSRVVVINTHATETLYVQFKTAAIVDPTTNQIAVPAGGSYTLDVYGLKARAMSVKGSTAGTTGRIQAWIFPY